jgi:hypothetical protein
MVLSVGSVQGFRFLQGDREKVPCGTQATAPESELFPPILSRHVRDAPPWAENISLAFQSPRLGEDTILKYPIRRQLIKALMLFLFAVLVFFCALRNLHNLRIESF